MRSESWTEEFGHLLPSDEETKALVLDGSIEICPCCGEMSAYSFDECTGYDEFPDGIVPTSFSPGKGKIAHIGTAGMHEWECGHCKLRLMDANSPLNHSA